MTSRSRVKRRIIGHVRVVDGCWLWTAKRDRHGYGVITVAGRYLGAHRVAFEVFRGTKLPPRGSGFQLDHLCRTRSCVNPDHLQLVSIRTNSRRSWIARRVQDPTARNSHPVRAADGRIITNLPVGVAP